MKYRWLLIYLGLIALIISGNSRPSFAQENNPVNPGDSTFIIGPSMDSANMAQNSTSVKVDSSEMNRPEIATFFSAALPGLGQVYNHNYWKLPILYGTAGVMGYYLAWNNNKYHQFLNALFDKQNNISNPIATIASVDHLKQGVDYYRHNRDFLMILMAGLYFMQIVDAQVQAQLSTFTISPNLTLEFRPVINDYQFMVRNVNMGIIITFN